MKEELSKKIYGLRVLNKDSQESLSKKLNVSRQTVSKWETGISCPDFNTLKLIADLYRTDMNYFFEQTTNMSSMTNDKLGAQSLYILDQPYFKLGIVFICILASSLSGPFSLFISIPYLIMSIYKRKILWSLVFLFLVLMGLYILMLILFPGFVPHSVGVDRVS